MKLNFDKYHACGNHFPLVDEFERELIKEEDRGKIAKLLCEDAFGVGADSVLYVLPPEPNSGADIRMRIFENDESESSMCGNGIRCIADFARSKRYVKNDKLVVQTKAGNKQINYDSSTHDYIVEMGELNRTLDGINSITNERLLTNLEDILGDNLIENISFAELDRSLSDYGLFTIYGTGEPHMVLFCEDIYGKESTKLLHQIGEIFNSDNSLIRNKYTPYGLNVNLIEVVNSNNSEIKIRTYERGVNNETLACGTGSTAAASAAYISGKVKSPHILVNVKGANRFDSNNLPLFFARGRGLTINVRYDQDKNVYLPKMAGPAKKVYSGAIDINNLLTR